MAVNPALNNLNVDGIPPAGGMPVYGNTAAPSQGNSALNNVNVDTVPTAEPGPESEAEDLNALFIKLTGWWVLDRDHANDWRNEARECYDFRDNRQWSTEDEAKLRENLRQPVTQNRIERGLAWAAPDCPEARTGAAKRTPACASPAIL